MAQPTYNDLLDLLEQVESQTGSHLSTAELLTIKFLESYPHITVSRPSRFLETVKRITAPIVSGRLQGDEKKEYLEREWTPRIRNPSKGLYSLVRDSYRGGGGGGLPPPPPFENSPPPPLLNQHKY